MHNTRHIVGLANRFESTANHYTNQSKKSLAHLEAGVLLKEALLSADRDKYLVFLDAFEQQDADKKRRLQSDKLHIVFAYLAMFFPDIIGLNLTGNMFRFKTPIFSDLQEIHFHGANKINKFHYPDFKFTCNALHDTLIMQSKRPTINGLEVKRIFGNSNGVELVGKQVSGWADLPDDDSEELLGRGSSGWSYLPDDDEGSGLALWSMVKAKTIKDESTLQNLLTI